MWNLRRVFGLDFMVLSTLKNEILTEKKKEKKKASCFFSEENEKNRFEIWITSHPGKKKFQFYFWVKGRQLLINSKGWNVCVKIHINGYICASLALTDSIYIYIYIYIICIMVLWPHLESTTKPHLTLIQVLTIPNRFLSTYQMALWLD